MPFEIPAETSRGDAKRRAILEVAREVFQARGYAAASMSEIATRVGGSKGTLYNYFRSKEELFSAFIAEACVGLAQTYFDPLPPIGEGRPVRESLVDLGIALMEFLQTPDIVALHRLVTAEVGRFPEIGRIFYEAGPKRGELRFTEDFEQALAAGRFPEGDPRVLGQRLKDLVMSDVYLRLQWGVLGHLGAETLRTHVDQSVDIFLRAFAPALR
jgi:TetR/AcrR family transcriptional regulator, mexJK operon transcriptional repressor